MIEKGLDPNIKPERPRPAPFRSLKWGLLIGGAGLGLFVGFGLFFEGVIGLSGAPFLSTDIGPVVLIGVGVVVLALGVFRRRPPTT